MSERAVNSARAVVDLAYSLLAVGIIVYTFRNELRRSLTAKRAAIEQRTTAVRDAATTARRRAEFYASPAFRDSLIRQENNVPDDCGCDDA